MMLTELNFSVFLLFMANIGQVTSQCSSPFYTRDTSDICYYYKKTLFSWADAYNQCLSKPISGVLIQIYTTDQFNALKQTNIDPKDTFWLGANNFASFYDSRWHWLDGSGVSNNAIQWCPNSTYDTAIGAYCAAYDSTAQCVTNYLCSTLLPAPCIPKTDAMAVQTKSLLTSRIVSTGACINSYGGAYANWWTYSVLLLNWFILFCFILYLGIHFNMDKRTVMIIIVLIVLSFMMITAFAILWGVQYQDIIQIPVILVVVGCVASIIFLVAILILVANRNHVRRWLASTIVTVVALIVECSLMLGLILCIAHCSSYVTLAYTDLDKDLIASLLAAVLAATSIIFFNGLLYVVGDGNLNRTQLAPSNSLNVDNAIPLAPTQKLIPRVGQGNNGVYPNPIIQNQRQIERATSPVDHRILEEFYTDNPKQMHKYSLEGRQYVVYEGRSFADIDPYRKDITEAMLLQDPEGLRESIVRIKSSHYAEALAEEIEQAEGLLARLT